MGNANLAVAQGDLLMFHRLTYSLGVVALFLAVAGLVKARDQPKPRTLKIGDPAPRLQTGRWIQGEPVTKLQTGTVYCVEFWATWCSPCRAAIPHVEALHRKYSEKGLVVIGQNIREDKDSLVAPFVKKKTASCSASWRGCISFPGDERKRSGRRNGRWPLPLRRNRK